MSNDMIKVSSFNQKDQYLKLTSKSIAEKYQTKKDINKLFNKLFDVYDKD